MLRVDLRGVVLHDPMIACSLSHDCIGATHAPMQSCGNQRPITRLKGGNASMMRLP